MPKQQNDEQTAADEQGDDAKLTKRSKRANTLGPTGNTVRRNLITWRVRRDFTQTQLAERVSAQGRPMTRQALGDIELGRRRVDADDLVALAIALDITPGALLMPETRRRLQEVRPTNETTVDAATLWYWLSNKTPLTNVEVAPEDVVDFQEDVQPIWVAFRALDEEDDGPPDAE
ncbi:MAG: helix-turn-helix transcriptional regulator [Gordonia sp. (in: high G+C Gram-positive bacteria)]